MSGLPDIGIWPPSSFETRSFGALLRMRAVEGLGLCHAARFAKCSS